jgi:TRAP-type mannitol/chloroaromatic compound transport system substrate-binding protein
MRIPGLGGEVMSRLGATVQVIPGGEIYPALERGAIDATEWVGPYDDEKLGFYKVAKYYYYPGWWEPGATITFYVNRSEWEKLPSAYREILSTAATDVGFAMQASYDAKNPAALERLLAQGVSLRRFPPDVMDAASTATRDLLEEQASKDAAYRKLYEGWKSFRDSSSRWFATAELAYSSFALVPPPRG